MNLKELLQSKKIKIGALVVGQLIVLLAVFQFGTFVGFKKASFSFQMGERYFMEMSGRGGNPIMGMQHGDFGMPHGSMGRIVSVGLPQFVVSDRDGFEKDITVGADTEVRRNRDVIKPEDLRVNDQVIILGAPNEKNSIDAKLIRVMPIIAPEIKSQN
jgi:hypothetical protein